MKRNTAELKEKLIQTGVEEIRLHGIDQLSLRTVANACGVTHGTPYRHFQTKENYLRIVLKRISASLAQKLSEGIDPATRAREQLARLGYNLIIFARDNPYFFEALFAKFPFMYMELRDDTILTSDDLTGFNEFKRIVVALRGELTLANHETETLLHFWSFISGLALLVNGPIGRELEPETIQQMINDMLSIYLKGARS